MATLRFFLCLHPCKEGTLRGGSFMLMTTHWKHTCSKTNKKKEMERKNGQWLLQTIQRAYPPLDVEKKNNKWTLWYVNFDMHTEAVFIDASLLCKCRSATRITEMLVKTGQTHATDNNTKLWTVALQLGTHKAMGCRLMFSDIHFDTLLFCLCVYMWLMSIDFIYVLFSDDE